MTEDGELEGESAWITYLDIEYVHPGPLMIALPKGLPTDVRKQLKLASELYWVSASAAGNRLRTALELMLDHLKIPRFRYTRKAGQRKRSRRSLHDRLEVFGSKRPELHKAVLAIKWLGNDAVHESLSDQDALDGFELLEHVLAVLFDKAAKDRKRIITEINRRKGARSRSQSR